MADTIVKQECWTVRGDIDLTCGQCGAVGAELSVGFEVEGKARTVHMPEGPELELSLRLVEGSVPVKLTCMGCGALTLYGDAAEATAA